MMKCFMWSRTWQLYHARHLLNSEHRDVAFESEPAAEAATVSKVLRKYIYQQHQSERGKCSRASFCRRLTRSALLCRHDLVGKPSLWFYTL